MNSGNNQDRLIIRVMSEADLGAISLLSAQLGYPIEISTLCDRWRVLDTSDRDRVLIAELHTKVVGWVHVYQVRLLESDGYVEIGGLVVNHHYRRQGIGSQLISQAFEWARQHGYTRVRLSSGMQRKHEAHLFYEALGFQKRDSQVFQKDIPL